MIQQALFKANGHSIKLPIWRGRDFSGPFALILTLPSPLHPAPQLKQRVSTRLCGLARND